VRRPAAILGTLITAVAVLTGTFGASARTSDTRSERDQVRADQARVASNLDTLKASQSQLTSALADLEQNLQVEEGRLADARQAVEAAKAQVAAAQRSIESTSTRLQRLKDAMAKVAVEAYVRPRGSTMSAVLEADTAPDAAERQALQGLRTNRDADLSDQIETAKAELQSQRRAAQQAQERAERKQSEVADRVEKVQVARAQQQRLVSGVNKRIQDQLAKASQLQAKNKALSNQLYREQLQLAARAAAQRAASVSVSTGYRSGGAERGPLGPTTRGPSANVDLCTVGGITINCQIASSVRSMLEAARGDGVSLSGSGWRDPAAQIALRRDHCGTSDYAIYQMSPSACHPPTALPGQSMHEVGLAIDFSNCESHSSACYQWLASHAGSYGLHNLPSEPWHWSVNGN